jgi:hypothetical protein
VYKGVDGAARVFLCCLGPCLFSKFDIAGRFRTA